MPELTSLGRRLFGDPVLSASGTTSCASCHDPARAFGPSDGLATPKAGLDGNVRGNRAAPSLTYLQSVPPFTEHMHEAEGDDSVDQGPAGGRTWDGRAATAHDQALLPLLSPAEMANPSLQALVARVEDSDSGAAMRTAFGDRVFEDPGAAASAILLALEVFQQSPAEFYPYTSKYDRFLRGEAKLTAQELRGLEAFDDPERGNCASCHPSRIKEGAFPVFTDFGYVSLGVPRNRSLPGNQDARHYDLGLCGPIRTDLAARSEYCGLFRTPSLRNVALRKSFFHNGSFNSLERVLDFYAERDTNPAKWYAKGADRRIRKFDDLPSEVVGHVNNDPPFGRKPGDRPALTKAERADIVAFLHTLTDGYSPIGVSNAAR